MPTIFTSELIEQMQQVYIWLFFTYLFAKWQIGKDSDVFLLFKTFTNVNLTSIH